MKNFTLKSVLLTLLLSILTQVTCNAQVGIGTTNPSGALDITSSVEGLLIPRVALSATNVATVLTPMVSELVYNTFTSALGPNQVAPGYYYWNGTIWVPISTGSLSAWSQIGNAGTNATTNFIGTTDAVDFVTRTNNTEKVRVTSSGNMGIGVSNPVAKLDVAAGTTLVNSVVNGTGNINDFLQYNIQNTSTGVRAQSGYSATADNGTATTGFAWIGINNSTFNFPTAYNVGGANDVSYVGSGQDMYIANANNTRSIIFSTGRATTPFFNERMRIRSDGSVGINSPGAATEKIKVVHSGAGNDAINAVNNDDNIGKGNAVWATNGNATGTSIIASSGATPPNILPNIGAGISGSHIDGYGVYANTGNGDPNTATHNGHAAGGFLLDNDNNVTTLGSSAFAKLAGKDNVSPNGILSVQNVLYGGYFQAGVSSPSYSYTGIKYNHNASGGGGTDFKVIGNGVASTIIYDEKNIPRIMFCTEAPEVLFEDYGMAKLNNGEAYVSLDKVLTSSMKIDDKHPLKVFIQLEGDCNGVFVTDKSNVGFRVKELNNGKSNVSFSWHIVGSRADSKDEKGNVNSEFENLRLPIGPTKLKEEILLEKEKVR
ncbi:hypothetical protein [Flavobacterium difficile]|uniref:Uncharacterized protein n=1 Tax=Flavobacterium difficile TaxID=2709659 RepID=A0ABX0I546_9FLAO|nr:hypothetical protein [Flavobacterium difficile]NHM02301.1 hypothetical protein [Flavobacterium difficile]